MRWRNQRRNDRAMALLAGGNDDAAPELSLLNLVDLMLVFAVGLMLAIVSYYGLKEVMLEKEATMVVSKPGSQEIDVIRRTASKVERMRLTQQSLDGEGIRIGIAYRLKSGEVVYVPESRNASSAAAGADKSGGQP